MGRNPFAEFALDLLYPPKCGVCGLLGGSALCDECRKMLRPLGPIAIPPNGVIEQVFAVHTYRTSFPIVQALKYRRTTSLGAVMGREMVDLANEIGLLQPRTVVVPVPIHERRRFERGFNQAEKLAAAFPAHMVDLDLMTRTRYTPQQVGLSTRERLDNVAGAFESEARALDRDIILIDDVFTSGATARECAKTLRAAGARSVDVLVYAGK